MPARKGNKKISPKKQEESGLASFVERPVPEEDEVLDFERALKKEVRDHEIDSHLSDVYSDRRGRRVDVKKMKIKKKPNAFFMFLKKIIILFVIIYAAYWVYNNYFSNNNDVSSLILNIEGPSKVYAGEEFSYKIEYENPSKYIFSDIVLEMQYPDNFVFDSASISPSSGNYGFSLPDLEAGTKGSLVITGKIINVADSVNLLVARLSYAPGSFSSHFKKEASLSTLINSSNLSFGVETPSAVFINQENELKLVFINNGSDDFSDYISDFDVNFFFKEGSGAEIKIAKEDDDKNDKKDESGEEMKIEDLGSSSWNFSNFKKEVNRQEVTFNYLVKNKIDDFELKISFKKRISDKDYIFWEKTLKPELASSDLSLSISANNSKNDQAINFGSNIEYVIDYSNLGDKAYEDVNIMAVIEGDLVLWDSLNDKNDGEIGRDTIIWTKKEISALEKIEAGEEGKITFSLDVDNFKQEYMGENLEIIAYAQYSINGQKTGNDSNKSNEIKILPNSDLSLNEEIRYFDNDNIPVGSGPLPPKVGNNTSVRVYWTVDNNLHDLRDARVVMSLPNYINFSNNSQVEVGNIYYNSSSREVVWEIGFLPVSDYQVKASFDINLTPMESDRDKILVLSPGSTVSALDSETKNVISNKTSAKTTRLEDDDIDNLNNSGRVE